MRLEARRWPTAPSGRVFLHIGAPATGATQLAETLRRHRRALTRYGLLYPTCHVGADAGHLAAVLDVLGLADGGHVTTGAWDRLVQSARDWRRGTVLVCHELLADADEDQVERVLGDLRGLQTHVVYVARDLGRQLPAAWQEWVRSGGTVPFGAYVDQVAGRAHGRPARMFWRSHDVAAVLDRWATFVPSERIHVLTVPAGEDAGATLWRRFAGTVGIDAARLPGGADPDRVPLALAAVEALRLLNAATGGSPSPALLDAAAAVAGPPPAVPARLAGWLHDEAERTIRALKDGGYDVVGDLSELRPPAGAARGGSDVPVEEVLVAQTAMLAHLTR